jgi:hypothetical protein
VCSRARRRKAATTSRALLAAELGQFQPGAAHRLSKSLSLSKTSKVHE